ncbi:hypothetical protein ACQPYK_39705 [Streptosporangium sp. CA-135522]|uniref:hypothetical protein n=1 Tax=Streptosporangium sp. CA-135522 TaxID=3240072 RepID=UPI003D8D154C
MNDKRRLTLISSALLTASVLGAAAMSQFSAVPASAQTIVASVPPGASATEPTAGAKPEAYWKAYRKGFMDAKGCDKGTSFSYDESADWDRKGWVDGYNAGHVAFCENTG